MNDTVVAPAAAVVDPAAAAVKPWYEGADPTFIGVLQTRGIADKSPLEAATNLYKSWEEAQKFVGAPPNELVRIPKADADEATVNAAWQRLGKPQDVKGYDFSAIKFADGSDLDPDFANTVAAAALKAHLPAAAAASYLADIIKSIDATGEAETAEKQAALIAEKQTLTKNWGANFDANKFVASQTAQKLGVTPEEVQALENTIGYARVMEMFRTIGEKTGEHTFVSNANPSTPGVMTREQALANKAELMRDSAWVKSYMDGDAAKTRQMTALNTLIVGDDTEQSRWR